MKIISRIMFQLIGIINNNLGDLTLFYIGFEQIGYQKHHIKQVVLTTFTDDLYIGHN